MRWSLAPASSGRPGSPAPSCSASLAAHPTSTSPWPPPTRRPGVAPATLYPSLAAAYPDLRARAVRRRRASTGSTSCSSACRTRRRWRWPRSSSGTVGCVVDLSAAFRLKDAALYPQWYGFEHDQPELLAEAVYGLPERHRDELEGRPARRHAGLLRHGGDAGARAAARRRADRAGRADRRRRQRRLRRRPGGRRRPTRSAPSTRTSSPTACSTTATRRRSSRTSAPRCCSRRTWRR